MRESQLYLNFFKNNFLIILLPTLVGLVVGINFFLTQPVLYRTSGTLKVITTSLIDSSVVADQVVANLRAERGAFLADRRQELSVYKSGPDTVEVSITGPSQSVNDLKNVFKEAKSKFNIKQLGNFSFNEFEVSYFKLLLGIVGGFSLGILLSLIKTYLKNY